MHLILRPQRFHPFARAECPHSRSRRRHHHHDQWEKTFDPLEMLSALPTLLMLDDHLNQQHHQKAAHSVTTKNSAKSVCPKHDSKDVQPCDIYHQHPKLCSPEHKTPEHLSEKIVDNQMKVVDRPASPASTCNESNEEEFRIRLDVRHFKPEELKVTLKENFVVIEGKHEERAADDGGSISRQFVRKYKLNDRVITDQLASQLEVDDRNRPVLVVTAPMKPLIELDASPDSVNIPIVTLDGPAEMDQDTTSSDPKPSEPSSETIKTTVIN